MISPGRDTPIRMAALEEHPLFFESGDRPCFGVHHAAPPAPEGVVVVHVHGLGVEQIALYREEVLSARAVAAAGHPVFRHHARGHGDSAGDFSAVTVSTLVEDARAAADCARRRTGAARVIWLGVRFGAIVAALAAGGRTDTAGFLFWEPVSRPMDFFRAQLRGMLFSNVAGGKKPDATVDQLFERITRDGSVDVHGYLLHGALVESARDVSLDSALAAAAPAPVRLIQVQQRARLAPAHAALVESLTARGVSVTTALISSEPGYQLMSNPAWESPELRASTVEAAVALA